MGGSVFNPDNLAAELYDSMGGRRGGETECRNVASAAVPTWILIIIDIVLVLAAITVRPMWSSV